MKKIITAVQIILVITIIWSGYTMYSNNKQNKETEKRYEALQQQYTTTTDDHKIRPQFEKLKTINKDIIGWINLEGTTLNYPILQSKDNKDYLQQDFEKQYTRKGSIFMDYRNDPMHTKKNTIIYGHNVGDGTMFDTIEQYLDQTYYDQHKTIQYDTKHGKYNLEIISAYETTTDDNYIQTDFKTDKQYEKFLENTMKKSQIATTTTINKNDKIITLSTCEDPYSQSKGRKVVVAKLVEAI